MAGLSDFDFHLPEELIAQAPLERRDGARLLTVDRARDDFGDRRVADLPQLLRPGDLLVLNDTRVIPARLVGVKAGTGGKAELLLMRPASDVPTSIALEAPAGQHEWLCLGQASKGLKVGTALEFAGGLKAEVLEERGGGEVRVRFLGPESSPLNGLLADAGRLPLPPYVRRVPTEADAVRYQTVFAQDPGSVAAPTAGLHFTESLLQQLVGRGVHMAKLTLDVGPGTFMPVREDSLDGHKMHPERYRVPAETARAVFEAKAEGRRVVAVGTTVVRTLESAYDPEAGRLRAGSGETRLFIRPGFSFQQVDAVITNFHLPKSTLIMLVSAFLGTERTLAAYRHAVSARYRFYSYGDAMLLT